MYYIIKIRLFAYLQNFIAIILSGQSDVGGAVACPGGTSLWCYSLRVQRVVYVKLMQEYRLFPVLQHMRKSVIAYAGIVA